MLCTEVGLLRVGFKVRIVGTSFPFSGLQEVLGGVGEGEF
jgi:hypothetical protein